jgi:NAD+ kinase
MQSLEPVSRVAVVPASGRAHVDEAVAQLRRVAHDAGVEVVERDEDAQLAIVLGGDGTMLRALKRFLPTNVPVLGVNFGRVGFLTALRPDELETGLRRAFAGEYRVFELPTLAVDTGGETHIAVNDAVVTSATVGRMVELEWGIDDEDLGVQPCDGVLCSTPSGSTAYNLSNGGPVLLWGIDAMVVTFVAPHSLAVRPLVIGRGRELAVCNRASDVPVTVLVDGQRVHEAGEGARVSIRLDAQRSLLATLPEVTFFRRYREHFGS